MFQILLTVLNSLDRTAHFFSACILALSFASGGYAQTFASLPNFDDVVYVDEPVVVYRDYSARNRFFVVPQTVLGNDEWSISVLYQRQNGRLNGNAVLSGPALIDDDVLENVLTALSSISPNPDLVVVQPQHSEYRVRLFGSKATVTDRFVVNPIGEEVSVSFDLEELPLRSLLHDTSYLVDVGILTFKFSVRGVEFDRNFNPVLTRRWFNIHSPIDGNCISYPERFLNVVTGQIGCIYSIEVSRSDTIRVQRFLRERGYYSAGIDGVIGPFTRDAVRAFQKDQEVFADGLITRRLIDSIAFLQQSDKAPSDISTTNDAEQSQTETSALDQ
ncbi:peptidoglycan-binding domain-containing protein [Primorskyibacter sp. 2E233]|uniref:peptidoglycan-binding domain-containing protein n=1 Tax=Primorskyibacter sp. 2E233 TaxID=3413431 RepID=UPI003BEF8FD2